MPSLQMVNVRNIPDVMTAEAAHENGTKDNRQLSCQNEGH
jgi:hypothetical protein